MTLHELSLKIWDFKIEDELFLIFFLKPLTLCYPYDDGSTLYMEEAVCWDLALWKQFFMAWLVVRMQGDSWWVLWHSHGIPEHFSCCNFWLYYSHSFSQNMPVFKFKGYSMWILVAVRVDSLCHLPKSTGLLLTREGEVKAVLAHFSPLSTPGSRSLKRMWFGSVVPSPVGGLFDSLGHQWLLEGLLKAFLVVAKENPPSDASEISRGSFHYMILLPA